MFEFELKVCFADFADDDIDESDDADDAAAPAFHLRVDDGDETTVMSSQYVKVKAHSKLAFRCLSEPANDELLVNGCSADFIYVEDSSFTVRSPS